MTLQSALTGSAVFRVLGTNGIITHQFTAEGTTGGGNIGTIDLRSGGSATVYLSSNGVSYFTGGNVAIGGTTAGYPLDVNGIIRGSNVAASDIRWKKEITPIKNALDKVTQLKGVHFKWKDAKKGLGLQIGVIAQEVEKVIPEVVTTSDSSDGQKGLSCTGIDAVLVEAIKVQQKEIEALKSELLELKKKYQ